VIEGSGVTQALAAEATVGASATGDLTIDKPLAGAATGGATAAGDPSFIIGLEGEALAGSTASGAVVADLALAGAAIGGATASATLPTLAIGETVRTIMAPSRTYRRRVRRKYEAQAETRNFRAVA
jgi:hypothetical protein